MAAASALQPRAVAKGARLVPKSALAARAAAAGAKIAAVDAASAALLPFRQYRAVDSAASGGDDVEAAEAVKPYFDHGVGEQTAVWLSATMFVLVRLVVGSPFVTAAEEGSLGALGETDTVMSVPQLRQLVAAASRALPISGTSEQDPMVLLPTPPPPWDAERGATSLSTARPPFFSAPPLSTGG